MILGTLDVSLLGKRLIRKLLKKKQDKYKEQ